jgi:hypothetical protein
MYSLVHWYAVIYSIHSGGDSVAINLYFINIPGYTCIFFPKKNEQRRKEILLLAAFMQTDKPRPFSHCEPHIDL